MIRAISAVPSAGSKSSLHPGMLCWHLRVPWGCTLFCCLGVALWALLVVTMTGLALLGRLCCIYSYSGLAYGFLIFLSRGTLLTASHCIQGQWEVLAIVTAVVARWVAMWQSLWVAEIYSGQWCLLAVNETTLPGKCWKAVSGLWVPVLLLAEGVSFSMHWSAVLLLICAFSPGTAQSVSLALWQGFTDILFKLSLELSVTHWNFLL